MHGDHAFLDNFRGRERLGIGGVFSEQVFAIIQ